MAGAGEGTNEIEREGGEGAGGKERGGGRLDVSQHHTAPCRPHAAHVALDVALHTSRAHTARAPHHCMSSRACPAHTGTTVRSPGVQLRFWGRDKRSWLVHVRIYARSTYKCCLGCKGCLGCMGAGTGDCCSDLRAGWLVAAAKLTASVSHSKRLAQVVGRPRNNRSEHRPAD